MQALPMYFAAKKAGRVERPRRQLKPKPNGRSADFIMAGFATGCQLACSYCYVARHRPFGNPVERYTNLDAILDATFAHHDLLPAKAANQTDPVRWTYDIGENTDCLTPAVRDLTVRTIEAFLTRTDAKPTFATKVAGGTLLPRLERDDFGRARVRASLLPEATRRRVEAGTSPVAARLRAVNEWVDRGYEVHLNFSPVIATPTWIDDYAALFQQVRAELSAEALAQVRAEVIFLTHHPRLHESNLAWHADAESLLWRPRYQESKTNGRGDDGVVRYRALDVKNRMVSRFRQLIADGLPECRVRYIF